MGGESSERAAEGKKTPEEFEVGESVRVKNSDTGEMEDWFFAGRDMRTGKAIVRKTEGFLKRVDWDALQRPKNLKDQAKVDRI